MTRRKASCLVAASRERVYKSFARSKRILGHSWILAPWIQFHLLLLILNAVNHLHVGVPVNVSVIPPQFVVTTNDVKDAGHAAKLPGTKDNVVMVP